MNKTSKRVYISKFINLTLSVFMLFTCISFTGVKANEDGTGFEEITQGDGNQENEGTTEVTNLESSASESETTTEGDGKLQSTDASQDDLNADDAGNEQNDDANEPAVASDNGSKATDSATIIYHKVYEGHVDSQQGGIALSPYTNTVYSSTAVPDGTTAKISYDIEWYQFDGWYDNEKCEGEPLSTDSFFQPTATWTMGQTYHYYAKFSYVSDYLKTITVNAYWIGDENNPDAKPLVSKTTTDSYEIGGRDVTIKATDYFKDIYFGYQLSNDAETSTETVQIRSEDSKNVANFYIYRKYVVLEAKKNPDVLWDGTKKIVTPGYISYLPTDATKTDLNLIFKGVLASGSGTDVGNYDVTFSKEDGGEIDYTAVDTTNSYVVNTTKNSTFNIVKSFPEFRFEYADYSYTDSYNGSGISGIPVKTTVDNGTIIKFRSSTDNGDTWSDWTTVQPSRTEVGTTKVEVEATNPNYEGTTLETSYTLTVTPKDMSLVTVSVEDVDYYDGNEHKQEPTVTDSQRGTTLDKGIDYTVSYSEDVVNAGTVTVTVTGKGNYTGTKTATYKINPRPVTVVSGSAEQEYNGKALTKNTWTYGDNSLEFVDGEEPYIEITGTITDVVKDASGNDTSVPNTFEVKESEDSKYKASNYDITKQEGTLKVTHIGKGITVYIQGIDAEYTYDGKGHDISSYKITDVEGVKKDLYDVNKNVKFNGELNKETYKDVNTKADGYPGSIYVADFENISNNFSSVEFIVKQGTVTIKPRTYTITTYSASKTYDGKALTAGGKIEGLVEGDTATFVVTGSQTEVGSSKNTYDDFAFTGNTKEANYVHGDDSIGTLTVTEKSSEKKSSSGGWDDGGPFTTDTCGNVFDRWGNKIYEAKGCNVGGYNLVSTSVTD